MNKVIVAALAEKNWYGIQMAYSLLNDTSTIDSVIKNGVQVCPLVVEANENFYNVWFLAPCNEDILGIARMCQHDLARYIVDNCSELQEALIDDNDIGGLIRDES